MIYTPSHFAASEADTLALMQAYAFAQVIDVAEGGEPRISYCPVVVDVARREIRGHVAAANPQAKAWRAAAQAPRVLAVFNGPHAYVSPNWYEAGPAVPTWNYMSAQVGGKLTLIDDVAGKEAVLEALIALHEPGYASQWNALPADYRERMLGAICAFAISMDEVHGKFKLSQNRPAADRSRVHDTLEEQGGDGAALARWMQQLGLVGPTQAGGEV